MRKFTIFALILILAFSFTACGRRDKTPTETTPSVTQAPTEQVTMPTIDPTMGTNIPDPEVDTSMPDLMDPTGESNPTNNDIGSANNSGNTTGDVSGSIGIGD